MPLSTHLMILVALFLSTSCKYSELPTYSFMGYDFLVKNNVLGYTTLSTDEDKIDIVSFNSSTSRFHHDIFNFDG